MSDFERLVKSIKKEVADINNYDTESLTPPWQDSPHQEEYENYLNDVLEYAANIAKGVIEDLESEGKLVIPPCKVGDIVWRITSGPNPGITKDVVRQISINYHGKWLVLTAGKLIDIDDFGKTVFLIREEAEAAFMIEQCPLCGQAIDANAGICGMCPNCGFRPGCG